MDNEAFALFVILVATVAWLIPPLRVLIYAVFMMGVAYAIPNPWVGGIVAILMLALGCRVFFPNTILLFFGYHPKNSSPR